MKRHVYMTGSRLRVKGFVKLPSYEGETIEAKCRRMTENKEPIKDGAPLVYTEKKDGVRPEFNIRTDKWAVVQEKMDAANRQKFAKSKGLNIPKQNEQETTETSENRQGGGSEEPST